MKRLTKKRDRQNVIPLKQNGETKWVICSAGMGDAPTEYLYGDHADRLAAYEDTGLEPEQVTELMAAHGTSIGQLTEYRKLGTPNRLCELAQADRDGRCVVLPFKPPRWVYVCSTRFPKPAQAHYASAINVLQDMDKGCVFGDTQEEAAAALRRKQDG